MNTKIFSILIFLLISITFLSAQNAETEYAVNNYHRYYIDGQKVKDPVKEKSIQEYRQYFARHGYRYAELKKSTLSIKDCMEQLSPDGTFSDLMSTEKKIYDEKLIQYKFHVNENILADFLTEAFTRIWKIADSYKKGNLSESHPAFTALNKAILHYGAIEISRSNSYTRFHSSCFAIPTAAVNIYFCMLSKMDAIEGGKNKDKQDITVCDMLKTLSLQAWTQPLRNDETDKNVVQLDRFRNNALWVGGNALAYRSLLPTAFMYKSIPMIDLVAQICQKCISTTSQNTNSNSFWTEGFTADGAGWGHGRQSNVWGYPIDGTSNALAILSILKESPWAQTLTTENKNALLNFFEGSNWYFYKGTNLPGIDRITFRYQQEKSIIKSANMVNTLLKDWTNSFSANELNELKQFSKEAATKSINMNESKPGLYSGTRWFFNNDDLIKKNADYHIFVNMASVRCDGLESAHNMADGYNFFADDGMTLFQRNGQEYRSIFGAWDITLTPGVTAREGMDKITPITNWRGFCSKFNYAGAATHGGENAVAGFVFEKLNAIEKDKVNDKQGTEINNTTIYGVKAHKAYFMMGDYFVALGAGITNKQPEMEGNIRTSIEQTARTEDIQIISNGISKSVEDGIQNFTKNGKPVWVKQKNKFAYTILPEFTKNAYYVCEAKKTNWVKMNKENAKFTNLPETVDVLKLWIDHGQKVVDETYGYVVYAGKDTPKDQLPFTVLRNDTLIQSISSNDSKITEVVFYQPNTELKTKEITLSASAPCTMLIEIYGNEKTISVNDPQMDKNLKQILLKLNGKILTIDMPQGELCGKPVTINI